ncbi:MAG: hypothetical protein M3552_01985 [Planctomycetota bacterium]|nr:hypothetical protein [Planctomycetota bacterium]
MWVPSSWEAVSYGSDGAFRNQSRNELISVALGLPVPDETFRFEYPPGTVVYDGRKDPPREFVIGGDGKFIPKRRYEAEATRAGSGGFPVFLALGIAGLTLVAGGLVWRWRRGSGS